ncbi:indole acetimide hydrolase, partial [Streptomyces sp. NPDC059853]
MDTTAPLWSRSAAELGRAVARGEIAAADVVDSHLERIAATNPTVGAVTQLLADRARDRARDLDRRRAGGARRGPRAR